MKELGGQVNTRLLRRLPLVVFVIAVVVWLVAKGSESGATFVQVTLNGLTLAALFFVVAAGFTLIFGL
ncbi:MAG: hypothetical protein WAL63_01130, partial [Solirubrobacteraceae bacterium]